MWTHTSVGEAVNFVLTLMQRFFMKTGRMEGTFIMTHYFSLRLSTLEKSFSSTCLCVHDLFWQSQPHVKPNGQSHIMTAVFRKANERRLRPVEIHPLWKLFKPASTLYVMSICLNTVCSAMSLATIWYVYSITVDLQVLSTTSILGTSMHTFIQNRFI